MLHLVSLPVAPWLRALVILGAVTGGAAAPVETDTGPIIQAGERDLQAVLDAAPPYATVDAGFIPRVIGDKGTIELRKPVRLINLKARLQDGVSNAWIVHIAAEHVVLEQFALTGNHPSVPQSLRMSLIRVGASHFRIENGSVENATRHGIHIEPEQSDLRFGIVRNIFGRGNQRDTVSVAGRGEDGLYTSNILVENVTSFDNNEGGGTEVKDGSSKVTVRNIFVRGGEYGVDIQDHRKPGQHNHDVIVDGVHAERTHMAVTTNAGPFGHTNFTIRNVTGRDFIGRLKDRSRVDIRNVKNVTLENVRISDNAEGDSIAVQFASGVILRNLTVENQRDVTAPAVRLVDLKEALVDGVFVRDSAGELPAAVNYHLTTKGGGAGFVRILNVFAPGQKTGIRLDRESPAVALTNYSVTDNLARVVDEIADPSARLAGNLP